MSGVLKCMDTKGEGVGWMGDWDWHIHTIDTMYEIDDKWELTRAQGTLLNALYWPKWERNPKKRGDKLEAWNEHIDTTIYKIGKPQGPSV